MNRLHHRDQGISGVGFSWIQGGWLILAAGFLLGMAYLWIYSQVVQTSNIVERFESKFDYLSGRSVSLQSELEKLQSPAAIIRNLEQRQIALVDPYPHQIVRVRQEERPPVKATVRPRPPRDLVILSIAR
ncbi:MAG: hypothetical protein V1789_11620 [PVC group bacterium]